MLTTTELSARVALSRAGRWRSLAFVIVGCVVSASLLFLASAFAVKEREKSRYIRQEVGGTFSELTAVNAVNRTSYRGRSVTLIQVPSNADARSLPPGLGAPLRPGEVRFSPALAARVDDDPVLRRWFPYSRGTTLPIESVNSAGEYKAYLGIAPADHVAGSVEGGSFTYDPEFLTFQQLGFVLFVAVPALALLATSTKIGRSARRERLAALRLLGMPGIAARATLGIEVGLPVALGAALATSVVLLVRFERVVLPVVDRWVFGQDARLGTVLSVGLAASLALCGFLVGAATPREKATGRLRGLVARGDPTRGWGVVIYAVGVGLIFWAYLREVPRDPRRFWGVLTAGIGMTGAVTHLGGRLARLLRWDSGPTLWFLAMRKLASNPRSHVRLAAIAAVVAFVIGVSQPVSQLITEPSRTWVGRAQEAGSTTVGGWVTSLGTSLSLPDAPVPPGVRVVLPVVGLWIPGFGPPAQPFTRGLVGTCAEVEILLAASLPRCDGTIQALGDPLGNPLDRQLPEFLELHGSTGEVLARVQRPLEVIEVPYDEARNPGPGFPELLIPPAAVSGDGPPLLTGLRLRTAADLVTWEDTRAWLMASTPLAHLENEFEGQSSTDTTVSWLVLGFGFVAGVALLGLGLTIFDEQKSGREWLALRVLGFTNRELLGVRLAIAGVSSLVAVAVATLPSVLVTLAYLRVVGDDLESIHPYLVGGAVCVGTLLVSTVVSVALQVRKLSMEAVP